MIWGDINRGLGDRAIDMGSYQCRGPIALVTDVGFYRVDVWWSGGPVGGGGAIGAAFVLKLYQGK